MSTPRHRRELPHEKPQLRYEPPIPLRSSDFDAVAPIRRPSTDDRRPGSPRELSGARR